MAARGAFPEHVGQRLDAQLMRRRSRPLFAAYAVALAFALAGLATVTAPGAHAAELCGRMGTPQEAEQLARTAASHLATHGRERAFRDFLMPPAGFMRDDLYVFAFDSAGTMWVNGGFPDLIGSNILNARDSQGRPFLFEGMQRAARDGDAWVEYTWYNPCNGKMMAKSAFIIAVGDDFVAVGAYGTVGT